MSIPALEPFDSTILEKQLLDMKTTPVLLITGAAGVGKRTLALHWVHRLFCDSTGGSPSNKPPCGKCPSCIRAASGQWLDLHWFAPESDDPDSKIGFMGIEPFRELKAKQGFGPSQEPYRVIVITQADRMTLAAANSILKMLEEPPPQWLFILTADNVSQVLPTIRSRCLLKRIPANDITDVESALGRRGISTDRAKILSRLSQGSLGRALELSSENLSQLRDQVLLFFTDPKSGYASLLEGISEGPRAFERTNLILESLLCDFLDYSVAPDRAWVNEDKKQLLLPWLKTQNFRREKIIGAVEHIHQLRRKTHLPLNAKLLGQELLRGVIAIR